MWAQWRRLRRRALRARALATRFSAQAASRKKKIRFANKTLAVFLACATGARRTRARRGDSGNSSSISSSSSVRWPKQKSKALVTFEFLQRRELPYPSCYSFHSASFFLIRLRFFFNFPSFFFPSLKHTHSKRNLTSAAKAASERLSKLRTGLSRSSSVLFALFFSLFLNFCFAQRGGRSGALQFAVFHFQTAPFLLLTLKRALFSSSLRFLSSLGVVGASRQEKRRKLPPCPSSSLNYWTRRTLISKFRHRRLHARAFKKKRIPP